LTCFFFFRGMRGIGSLLFFFSSPGFPTRKWCITPPSCFFLVFSFGGRSVFFDSRIPAGTNFFPWVTHRDGYCWCPGILSRLLFSPSAPSRFGNPFFFLCFLFFFDLDSDEEDAVLFFFPLHLREMQAFSFFLMSCARFLFPFAPTPPPMKGRHASLCFVGISVKIPALSCKSAWAALFSGVVLPPLPFRDIFFRGRSSRPPLLSVLLTVSDNLSHFPRMDNSPARLDTAVSSSNPPPYGLD